MAAEATTRADRVQTACALVSAGVAAAVREGTRHTAAPAVAAIFRTAWGLLELDAPAAGAADGQQRRGTRQGRRGVSPPETAAERLQPEPPLNEASSPSEDEAVRARSPPPTTPESTRSTSCSGTLSTSESSTSGAMSRKGEGYQNSSENKEYESPSKLDLATPSSWTGTCMGIDAQGIMCRKPHEANSRFCACCSRRMEYEMELEWEAQQFDKKKKKKSRLSK